VGASVWRRGASAFQVRHRGLLGQSTDARADLHQLREDATGAAGDQDEVVLQKMILLIDAADEDHRVAVCHQRREMHIYIGHFSNEPRSLVVLLTLFQHLFQYNVLPLTELAAKN